MKPRNTEKEILIPAIDYEKRMMFEFSDIKEGMEYFCGTVKAYIDRTTEKVVKVELIQSKHAYKVYIKKL